MKNVMHNDLFDHASYTLQSIRSKISRTNQRIRQNLDRIVKNQGNQKLSDAIVTVRNDRNVIPVKLNIDKISMVLFMTNRHQDKHYILNRILL